ncbi:MAG: CPBP family intramembrane metalloprotease [Terracidiphilus sp.]|nr:CPBP family intramembrane metalloprotease [Terracidiphilus sp.]MDR3798482.1 CPBP family intramembrane metalloprotease [Terracidiphilus sp.]
MQANSTLAAKVARPAQIASWKHLAGFIAIMAALLVLGLYQQHAGGGSGAGSNQAPGQLASHQYAIPIYLTALVMDWALLYFCWAGVHWHGGNLWDLAGGRWKSWRDVLTDLAILLPFWAVWEGAAYCVHLLLGSGSAKSVDSLLPKSIVEVLVWIATCITAGICEEMAFRGYLQRQIHALTGNIAWAVVLQALVFGIAHGYQGWRNVVVISVLGVLYGALAAWRKNLRVNIISHAGSDIWEGWLKFVVFR